VLTIGAFGAWAKQTISAAGALADLRKATGSSVEGLSAYTNQMAIAGVESEKAHDLIFKMSAGMADAGSKASLAMKALGVTARDPVEALKQVAVELDKYKDGAEKAAYTNAILKKSGYEVNAMLHDLAEGNKVAATVTTEQAEAADKLEDQLRKLRIESHALADVILSDVVPAILSMIRATQSGGAKGALAAAGITPEDRANLTAAYEKTKQDIDDLTKRRDAFLNAGSFVAWYSSDDIAIANTQLGIMAERLKNASVAKVDLSMGPQQEKKPRRKFPTVARRRFPNTRRKWNRSPRRARSRPPKWNT
jgi:hypothetical protein